VNTKLSTKGQVVLPRAIRDRMNLREGDALDARIEGERIVLIPNGHPRFKLTEAYEMT
jgi:AbrB family looped-hinge helix DNA binding protein